MPAPGPPWQVTASRVTQALKVTSGHTTATLTKAVTTVNKATQKLPHFRMMPSHKVTLGHKSITLTKTMATVSKEVTQKHSLSRVTPSHTFTLGHRVIPKHIKVLLGHRATLGHS